MESSSSTPSSSAYLGQNITRGQVIAKAMAGPAMELYAEGQGRMFFKCRFVKKCPYILRAVQHQHPNEHLFDLYQSQKEHIHPVQGRGEEQAKIGGQSSSSVGKRLSDRLATDSEDENKEDDEEENKEKDMAEQRRRPAKRKRCENSEKVPGSKIIIYVGQMWNLKSEINSAEELEQVPAKHGVHPANKWWKNFYCRVSRGNTKCRYKMVFMRRPAEGKQPNGPSGWLYEHSKHNHSLVPRGPVVLAADEYRDKGGWHTWRFVRNISSPEQFEAAKKTFGVKVHRCRNGVPRNLLCRHDKCPFKMLFLCQKHTKKNGVFLGRLYQRNEHNHPHPSRREIGTGTGHERNGRREESEDDDSMNLAEALPDKGRYPKRNSTICSTANSIGEYRDGSRNHFVWRFMRNISSLKQLEAVKKTFGLNVTRYCNGVPRNLYCRHDKCPFRMLFLYQKHTKKNGVFLGRLYWRNEHNHPHLARREIVTGTGHERQRSGESDPRSDSMAVETSPLHGHSKDGRRVLDKQSGSQSRTVLPVLSKSARPKRMTVSSASISGANAPGSQQYRGLYGQIWRLVCALDSREQFDQMRRQHKMILTNSGVFEKYNSRYLFCSRAYAKRQKGPPKCPYRMLFLRQTRTGEVPRFGWLYAHSAHNHATLASKVASLMAQRNDAKKQWQFLADIASLEELQIAKKACSARLCRSKDGLERNFYCPTANCPFKMLLLPDGPETVGTSESARIGRLFTRNEHNHPLEELKAADGTEHEVEEDLIGDEEEKEEEEAADGEEDSDLELLEDDQPSSFGPIQLSFALCRPHLDKMCAQFGLELRQREQLMLLTPPRGSEAYSQIVYLALSEGSALVRMDEFRGGKLQEGKTEKFNRAMGVAEFVDRISAKCEELFG